MEVRLWLLDIDYCRPMFMDGGGVDQAVATFYRNGPYYPRLTSSQDYRTWANFRFRYLHMSESALCSSQIDAVLAKLFVRNLESPLKDIELKW